MRLSWDPFCYNEFGDKVLLINLFGKNKDLLSRKKIRMGISYSKRQYFFMDDNWFGDFKKHRSKGQCARVFLGTDSVFPECTLMGRKMKE